MADKKAESTTTKSQKDSGQKSPAQKHEEEKAKSHAHAKTVEMKKSAKAEKAADAKAEPAEAKAAKQVTKVKPTIDAETKEAMAARAAKKAVQPRFRRHEWWRYKRLGGKHASWRVPRGIHSKVRRHYGYRPPLVSIGYRGPNAARGLHPSGFEEVMVHTLEELKAINKTTQAARVGGTVGGRRAAELEAEADKLGIRILNRRN